jgi:hypothetical protein
LAVATVAREERILLAQHVLAVVVPVAIPAMVVTAGGVRLTVLLEQVAVEEEEAVEAHPTVAVVAVV